MNDLHVCIINKCKYVIVIFIYECTHVCLCTKQKKKFHLVSLARSYTHFPPSPKEGERVVSWSQICKGIPSYFHTLIWRFL